MINLAIGLAGLILCGLGLLLVSVGGKMDSRTERRAVPFYVCLLLFAGSNLAGQLMRGQPGPVIRRGLLASNFLEFFLSYFLLLILSDYLFSIIAPERKRKKPRVVMVILTVCHVVFLILSQFTGLYYTIDASNVYQRGGGYPLSFLWAALILGIDCAALLSSRKKLNPKEYAAFWIYFGLTITASILQIFIYGVNIIVFASVVAGLTIFILMIEDQTERYYRQEAENTRLRVDVMLSQIQPHFLYNTLGAIQFLCGTDPAAAQAAILKFSRYLQGNMASLTDSGPIPFLTELEHTKLYLELEQMRYESALAVRYEIGCTAFSIPTLTLQPLVENAVRHGVRGAEGGVGTVAISTREYPDRVEIRVSDDGPGFDPSAPAPADDGRAHIGIENVRKRLACVCGGRLKILSAPGHGTTAVMSLPKEEVGGNACVRHRR